MKILQCTVQCLAVYNSSIAVPDGMDLKEAIRYAKEHIGEIPLGPMGYVPDSDQLDEDNCDFGDEEA